jgi:hypothetical protein
MRHRCRTVLLSVAAVVLLTSCSTSQAFHLLVTVLTADGTPVAGAKVLLDTQGVEERKLDPEYGWPHDGATDAQGRFAHDFSVSPYPSDDPRWYLKVSKDGFETVVIDIKPDPQPEKSRERIELTRTVELRPKPPPAR